MEASRLLVAAAGIETFLIDTGIDDERLCSPADVAVMGRGTAYEVVGWRHWPRSAAKRDRARGLRRDRRAGAARVHCGGRKERCRVSGRARSAVRTSQHRRPRCRTIGSAALGGGRHRIADPVINAWLAWTAIEAGLPLQIHVGYGDADLDLLRADPLRLTPFLRATEKRGTPVLLLHNYPFHRHAAYLAWYSATSSSTSAWPCTMPARSAMH